MSLEIGEGMAWLEDFLTLGTFVGALEFWVRVRRQWGATLFLEARLTGAVEQVLDSVGRGGADSPKEDLEFTSIEEDAVAARAHVEVDALKVADDEARAGALGTSRDDVAACEAFLDVWVFGELSAAALATAGARGLAVQRFVDDGLDNLWTGKGVELTSIEPEAVAMRAAVDEDAARLERGHQIQAGRAAEDVFGSHGGVSSKVLSDVIACLDKKIGSATSHAPRKKVKI
jgi:hypothetical protein